ncbi:MAG TPA: SBBP repeat-containing protein [Acidimicrobiales bacterium]|nr:SBBP repeat-containing protein [Acidimicrobiales bacterium]
MAALAVVVASGSAVAGVLASGGRTTQVQVIAPPGPADSSPGPVAPARPTALAVARDGGLYIADPVRQQILERHADGRFVVVAGTGHAGFSGDGGPATHAAVNSPAGMAVGADGTLYFADQGNRRVRSISISGSIRTVAGGGSPDSSGFVPAGTPATRASFIPSDVTFGPDGRLFIATGAQVLRLQPDGTLTPVVGAPGPNQGLYGLGGPATAGSADSPTGIAFDSTGNLYIAGFATKSLLMVTPDGTLTQPAGTKQLYPRGDGGLVTAPDGGVLAMGVQSVLSISPHQTRTITSFEGGLFHGIRGFSPDGIALGSDGTIYVDTWSGNGYSDRTAIAAIAPDGVSSRILWESGSLGEAPGQASQSSSGPQPASGPIVLRGDGVASVKFGATQAAAVADLDGLLGSMTSTKPGTGLSNCDVDTSTQWPMLTAFFFKGRFVGYSTLSVNGETLSPANVATSAGLRVGDTLARARQLYGSALTTSFAQGGAWFVHTPSGVLEGYLTSEPNQPSSTPSIASIEAGSVGCPAATP